MDTLKIQSKGRGELASVDPREGWKDSDLDFLLFTCKSTREIIEMTRDKNRSVEDYEDEKIVASLKEGKIIYLPMILFRAIVGEEECPLCGATFVEGAGALSRRDNETIICSDCGTREAFEDLAPIKK